MSNFFYWLRFWFWYRPLAWLRREKIFVDARRGNDDSPGTVTAPIRTLAELHRRTHGRVLRGDLFIQLEGEFDEVLQLSVSGVKGVVVTVAGGSEVERRQHTRAVKRFARELLKARSKLSARDYPEPPAEVRCSALDMSGVHRGVLKCLRIRR